MPQQAGCLAGEIVNVSVEEGVSLQTARWMKPGWCPLYLTLSGCFVS